LRLAGRLGPSAYQRIDARCRVDARSRARLLLTSEATVRILLAVAVLFMAARQAATEDESPLSALTSSVQGQHSDPGIVSVQLTPQDCDDGFNVPAVLRLAPAAGPTLVRDTELTMVSGVSFRRRTTGSWSIAPPEGISISARRPVVSRSSFVTSIGSYTVLADAMSARYAAEVSAWVGDDKHGLSLAAGLSRGPGAVLSRAISAGYVGLFGEQLVGSAELAYIASRAGIRVGTSGALSYQLRPGLHIDLSVRHERVGARRDSALIVGAAVSTS
jgi:hypothetical protein